MFALLIAVIMGLSLLAAAIVVAAVRISSKTDQMVSDRQVEIVPESEIFNRN